MSSRSFDLVTRDAAGSAPRSIGADAPASLSADAATHPVARRLEALRAAIRVCRACPLATGRTQAVPGEGGPTARIVVVGEAPGADEDAQGRPFVGRSGRLLRQLLTEAGADVTRDVYITNTNRCRPPGNRASTVEERFACRPHLAAELAVLTPRVVVLLGLTAAHNLLGVYTAGRSLNDLRGWHDGPPGTPLEGLRCYVTFHPAAGLRRPAWREALRADLTTLIRVTLH